MFLYMLYILRRYIIMKRINLNKEEQVFTLLKTYMMKFEDDEQEVEIRIGHSMRVGMLCELLGNMERMNTEQVNQLLIAGRMHDISKYESDKFHALMGAIKSREICLSMGYDEGMCDNICSIIMTHSDKDYYNKHLTKSQQILIECDIIEHSFLVYFKEGDNDINKIKKILNKQKKLNKMIKTKSGKKIYKLYLGKLKSYYKKVKKNKK